MRRRLLLLLLWRSLLPLSAPLTLTRAAQASELPRPAPSPFAIQLDRRNVFNLQPNIAFGFDGEGSYVAVWSRFVGTQAEVVGRFFELQGKARGPIFEVSSSFSDGVSNQLARVAMSPRNSFVVVWLRVVEPGEVTSIHAQLFTTGGARIGEQIEVAPPSNDSVGIGHSAVGIDHSGAFVVAWNAGRGVFLRRFDRRGAALGPPLLVDSHGLLVPAIVMQPGGSFVLAWSTDDPNAPATLVGRRFGRSAEPLGDEFQISGAATLAYDPATAVTPEGGFVVSWTRCPGPQPPASCDILARSFDPTTHPRSGEILLSRQDGRATYSSAVAVDPGGNALIVWYTCPFSSGDCTDTFRTLDRGGEPSPEAVTLAAHASVGEPNVAAGPLGFIVVYDAEGDCVYGGSEFVRCGLYGWRFTR